MPRAIPGYSPSTEGRPELETNVHGKDDPAVAAGVSGLEFGLRLGYGIRPEFAHYVAGATGSGNSVKQLISPETKARPRVICRGFSAWGLVLIQDAENGWPAGEEPELREMVDRK